MAAGRPAAPPLLGGARRAGRVSGQCLPLHGPPIPRPPVREAQSLSFLSRCSGFQEGLQRSEPATRGALCPRLLSWGPHSEGAGTAPGSVGLVHPGALTHCLPRGLRQLTLAPTFIFHPPCPHLSRSGAQRWGAACLRSAGLPAVLLILESAKSNNEIRAGFTSLDTLLIALAESRCKTSTNCQMPLFRDRTHRGLRLKLGPRGKDVV